MSRQPTWDRRAADPGGDVHRDRAHRRARRAARLFPRLQRMPRVEMGERARRSGALMTGVDCRGGNTQIGKVLTHIRREATAGAGQRRGLCRRCDGGEYRRAVPDGGRDRAPRRAASSCSRKGAMTACRDGLSRDRPADARRLFPLRYRLGEAPARASGRGRRLCRGRARRRWPITPGEGRGRSRLLLEQMR